MSQKRYWFVAFVWRRPGEAWTHDNCVLDEHPVDWLVEQVKHGHEDYRLTLYREIREEKYHKVKKETGLGF